MEDTRLVEESAQLTAEQDKAKYKAAAECSSSSNNCRNGVTEKTSSSELHETSNMVLLLGACPEYGCLVYEYMANGSLEDRLNRKGNMQALSWQLRFRIAAEMATDVNFLHQMKPEPLLHRDIKLGNILLDSNYVSKISDVGLARLVPQSVAEDATQFLMTSTARTFFYVDLEYQQTGMLRVKSDAYSFGVLLLQLRTAKSLMGLTHTVG
ncbi:kinase with adenine nucleotide alpha hydrolases-like domain-containing protein [Perilla frutescens var. hirtella]|uniref:RING-type E3 ubiquitin transferase n=1 Tax=Perilla frutescens var. hirtella TaxID=608512 RepID=A0AAD4JAQ0_PERFH|nr:kinase with adenine nucleotide alpha hydrolases-like domain-containing protein [Perilla frutescens var. hirtella]